MADVQDRDAVRDLVRAVDDFVRAVEAHDALPRDHGAVYSQTWHARMRKAATFELMRMARARVGPDGSEGDAEGEG